MQRNRMILGMKMILALVFTLIVLSVAWLTFFLKMPYIKTNNMEKTLCAQVQADAKAGAFSVEYQDDASVRVDSMNLVSGHNFAQASGIVSTDQGRYVYSVILRKAPLVGGYLYDTRYRFDSIYTQIDTQDIFAIYQLHITSDDTINVHMSPFWGRIAILCYMFFCCISLFKPNSVRPQSYPSK